MTPIAYSLSCEKLRLHVEFALGYGEFGRIGSSPEMEISLPLVGLLEEECRISLDEAGTLWLIRKGREAPVQISPPSYFHAGPYRFLIREKVEEPVPSPKTTILEHPASPPMRSQSKKRALKNITKARLSIALILTTVCLGGTAWYIHYSSTRPLLSKGNGQAKTESSLAPEKTESIDPNPPSVDPKKTTENTTAPRKATNAQKIVDSQPAENLPPAPMREQEPMDLEKLAVTVVPCVFLIEIFDLSGSQIGTGTGFSVSADGLVATNHHVVENGQAFALVTSQGAKFDNAEIVVSDPEKDLALLRIDSKDLPYLPLAESSKVPLGKKVAIYGSPRGLAGSLSEGIISASERNLSKSLPGEKIPNNGNLIQTTAPISPGSSGSPLFDAEGKVLGVMTLSLQQNAQNLNFAIPVEALKSLIGRARETPPTLGQDHSSTKMDLDMAIQDEPAYRRLRQQMSVGNWVESLKITGFLAEKFPKSPLIHFQNGYCAGMLRLDNQAEQSYTKVIELDPLNQLAWNNLGLALSSQKKLQDALIAFEKAVSINPNYPQAWDNIVRTNAVLGNWPKATTALNTLAQVDLKIAREFARPLVGLRIPDANFRQALERVMSHEVADTGSNSNVKFRVVGVSPDDPLAVRSGPGANFPRVISIANGEEVFVTGAGKMNGSTEWLPIVFGNSSGWVASKYLKSSE